MNYEDRLLSDLAISLPMVTEIFRRNRLDFCCGGKQTLKEACAKKQIDLNGIVEQIQKLETSESSFSINRPLNEITEFITSRYHHDLRQRLPELLMLSQKLDKVHGDHPAFPVGLSLLLKNFHDEMLMHMLKEENVLFPLINGGRGSEALMPVKVMMMDHDSHGKELEKIHQLTSDFNPPPEACMTWRSLYRGLEALEGELMEHIHLENNILFPKALAQTKT